MIHIYLVYHPVHKLYILHTLYVMIYIYLYDCVYMYVYEMQMQPNMQQVGPRGKHSKCPPHLSH